MAAATVKVSFRVDSGIYATGKLIAEAEGVSTEAYFQRIVTRDITDVARRRNLMDRTEIDRLEREQTILERAVRHARELDEAGEFDEHFILTVVRGLMTDPGFRADYEAVVGGDAYENGLAGKFPLNMHLGWYIKNAIPDVIPVLDAKRKPRRMYVRNEPIQSYTLLTKRIGSAAG